MRIASTIGTQQTVRDATPSAQKQASPDFPSAEFKEDVLVLTGGAALFTGLGAVVGGSFGDPMGGAIRGLGLFALSATTSAILDRPKVESAVFNWSRTMPGYDATPGDLDHSSFKNRALFSANLATNTLVLGGVGAAGGAILAGLPGAIVGGCAVLAAGSFAELLMG